MSVIGVGTDIIEISRIRESIERQGERFLKKIYNEEEILYCENMGVGKYASYAARFAVKEALTKAMPEEIDNKISWLDVWIEKKNKKPILRFSKKTEKFFENFKINISLSHSQTMATAFVIVEEKQY
jgi:holo-[acyl-carrier protein] synthase